MHLGRRLVPLGLVLCASLSGSGCAFIFTEGPPERHQQLRYFDCSSNYVAPVLDTIWGGLNGIGAARALATPEAEWTANTSRGATIGVGLAWLALSGASAIYGYSKVSDCRAAKSELMHRMERRRAPDETWPPPRRTTPQPHEPATDTTPPPPAPPAETETPQVPPD